MSKAFKIIIHILAVILFLGLTAYTIHLYKINTFISKLVVDSLNKTVETTDKCVCECPESDESIPNFTYFEVQDYELNKPKIIKSEEVVLSPASIFAYHGLMGEENYYKLLEIGGGDPAMNGTYLSLTVMADSFNVFDYQLGLNVLELKSFKLDNKKQNVQIKVIVEYQSERGSETGVYDKNEEDYLLTFDPKNFDLIVTKISSKKL